MYFWRTLQQQKIDYLEEMGGQVHGYEFKWRKAKYTVPKAFREAYPASTVQQISSSAYENFVNLGKGTGPAID